MADFFGFNTAMPGRQGGRVALNLEEQQELDRQVQKYALETGEDFEIYDYGETYDNLADDLEETRDDLNDETFGDVQRDEGKFSFLGLQSLIATHQERRDSHYTSTLPVLRDGHLFSGRAFLIFFSFHVVMSLLCARAFCRNRL